MGSGPPAGKLRIVTFAQNYLSRTPAIPARQVRPGTPSSENLGEPAENPAYLLFPDGILAGEPPFVAGLQRATLLEEVSRRGGSRTDSECRPGSLAGRSEVLLVHAWTASWIRPALRSGLPEDGLAITPDLARRLRLIACQSEPGLRGGSRETDSDHGILVRRLRLIA